jgi:hypothetical protein
MKKGRLLGAGVSLVVAASVVVGGPAFGNTRPARSQAACQALADRIHDLRRQERGASKEQKQHLRDAISAIQNARRSLNC